MRDRLHAAHYQREQLCCLLSSANVIFIRMMVVASTAYEHRGLPALPYHAAPEQTYAARFRQHPGLVSTSLYEVIKEHAHAQTDCQQSDVSGLLL